MRKQVFANNVEGKKIKKCIKNSYDVIFIFEDESFLFFTNTGENLSLSDLLGYFDEEELVEGGFISQKELGSIMKKEREEMRKEEEKRERFTYESLKKKFEG